MHLNKRPSDDSGSASQGNLPPPSPLQSETPTWDEYTGPVHMSQPQNNVYPTPSKETKLRIGRGLHSADAPLVPPLISSLKSAFRKRKKSTFKSTLPTPFYDSMEPVLLFSSQENGGQCPVCLKPLSFSIRLPGEKPHIVPECGHALHEVCFIAKYGRPPSRNFPQKSNFGACSLCKRPMNVADIDGDESNNALTGIGDNHFSSPPPGRDTRVTRTRAAVKQYDPKEDDPLVYNSGNSLSAQNEHGQHNVAPSIHVRPEFSSLTRTNGTIQPLTCVVVVELPRPVIPKNYAKSQSQHSSSGPSSPHPDDIPRHRKNHELEESFQNQRQLSNTHHASTSSGPETNNYNPNTLIHSEEDSPFHTVIEDLRNRIVDWDGHPLSDLGPLQMYDLLSVRRENALREFHVYLFREAIICAAEEKKRSIISHMASSKGVLRLKGKIYVGHIKNIIASSAAGEISLTFDKEDEPVTFIFKDRASLESWGNNIKTLVNLYHAQNGSLRHQEPERSPDIETFRGNQKAMRLRSGTSTVTTVDSLLNNSGQSTTSPTFPLSTMAQVGEDDEFSDYDDTDSSSDLMTPHNSEPSSLSPLPHPQMDLILVISLPPPKSLPSTAQIKIKVIKATLYFLVAHLGPKDRLSLVTFEVGMGGNVRKTPFLMVGRPHSRARLEKFIDEIGVKLDENKDEFLVRESKEEKTDTITAVDHGLHVVLQRKERSPVSGFVLISDASDSIRRTQMDVVLARAETANVPIHSFGYGRSHDTASLWLVSNRTGGTYTFVRDWYDLQDCVAGCVGGMMSIGLLNMKLRLKVVDNYHFKIRKVSGGPQFVLSDDGVDIYVGEIRYGERKEMLVELELDNNDQQRLVQKHAGPHRAMNATDQFVQSLGITIDEGPDLVDGMMDGLIVEVPVLEVNGSFFDPAAVKNVSRLAHPVLLTISLLPGSQNSERPPAVSDPVIVRRRMELVASDMITRALISKQGIPEAQKTLGETKRILRTVLQTISLLPHTDGSGPRNSKELLTLGAVRTMQAILQDLQLISEGLEDNAELFAHDQKNFGAQQAMILRDQKSWSNRSATESLFWTADHSIKLASRSTEWVARD